MFLQILRTYWVKKLYTLKFRRHSLHVTWGDVVHTSFSRLLVSQICAVTTDHVTSVCFGWNWVRGDYFWPAQDIELQRDWVAKTLNCRCKMCSIGCSIAWMEADLRIARALPSSSLRRRLSGCPLLRFLKKHMMEPKLFLKIYSSAVDTEGSVRTERFVLTLC